MLSCSQYIMWFVYSIQLLVAAAFLDSGALLPVLMFLTLQGLMLT